ncbi:MAG TPA: bifunctional 3-(3-hydroxy-phenyl)propionate/3-hydroxycinnamic acid hydroxylase [Candidatus Dormibacteraeota bacterium]|nr:bifunctional 3-(3-hydroxy-phenyl)propionate/3-hydroxycinnamic acid hydroxylase [Candidatus Dormibacteraeota bacterium]
MLVGYGPVGETLAILLAQRGWRVGVFEKQPAAYALPRAVHFDHEVARILQAAGIADGFAGLTETADCYEWRNAAGETLLRFHSRPMGASGWPEGNMFPQPELERLLDTRVRAFANVDVERGCEIVDLAVDAAGVTLSAARADGERVEARARFVVGCDGANSFVRSQIGATVTDLGFFYDWLIVDVLPHRPTRWSPLNVQICDPQRPTTMVSGGPGRRRWEFMRLPGESIEELNSEATAWRLLAPWGVRREDARLERHTVYRFQARWVDGWRQGRILLAGDAAHQMPPFAGQGMCAGVRDAANLAWKLDLVLAGTAPESLLDTYEPERVQHVRLAIGASMELGKVICIADPAEAAARDRAMISAAAAGQRMTMPAAMPIGAGVGRAGDATAGQLFIQGRVRHRGISGLFDDVVGRGWTLLAVGGDPLAHLDPETAAFLSSLGGITAHIDDGGIEDLDGTYRRWFDEHGVGVVLQRPDFYLFGSAPRVEDAGALIADLRRKLGSASP